MAEQAKPGKTGHHQQKRRRLRSKDLDLADDRAPRIGVDWVFLERPEKRGIEGVDCDPAIVAPADGTARMIREGVIAREAGEAELRSCAADAHADRIAHVEIRADVCA